MAGGRDNNKQSGNLDRIHQWLYCHQLYASVKPELPSSETFKKHQHIEKNRIVTKSLNDLQDNILRLLYSNSNFSKEEQLLVEHILSIYTSKLVNASSNNKVLNISKRYVDSSDCYLKSTETTRNVREYAIVDVSPTISDMADSGLETGSVSPHENTTSENSSTDFEELQVTEYTSGNDKLDEIRAKHLHNNDEKVIIKNEHYNLTNNYDNTCHSKNLVKSGLMEYGSNDSATCCSFNTEQPQLDFSSSSMDNAQKTKSNADEIFQYESQILSDPFYESDCGSDENESFEFINLGNVSSTNIDVVKKNCTEKESTKKLQDEKMCHSTHSQTENVQSENINHEISHDNQRSSCNTSNYYFIDASTLNDEVEIPTSNVVKNKCNNEKLQSYISYSSKYVANTSIDLVEEQYYKFTSLKTTNLQTERITEFEKELKLTEYLEPQKIKRINSISKDKINTEINKESLVVEIKEADSGESAHPSPCPDNNKNINNDRHVTSQINNDTNLTIEIKKEIMEQTNDKDVNLTDDMQQPSLIRRNTFELDSNDEKLSVLRQEYERRQGNLVFQNAIPQYSGHRVDGDSCFNPPDESSIPISNVLNKFPIDVQIPTSSQYHTMQYLSLDNGEYENNQISSENNNSLKTKTNISYPVIKSASDKIVTNYHSELDNDSSKCSNSLPVTLGSIIEKDTKIDNIKKN